MAIDLAAMGDLVPDSIIGTDADGLIRLWNLGATRLYGWREEQALGTRLDDLLASHHPAGLPGIREELHRAGEWCGEMFRRTADGREICARIRRQVRPGGNAALAMLEWGRDVGEVSASETAAHRYTNVFHAMAVSFWELDFGDVRKAIGALNAASVHDVAERLRSDRAFIDGAITMVRVVDVNDTTVELFGAPSRAAVLSGPMDWAWPVESRHIFAESLVAAVQRRDRYSAETTFLRMDGSRMDALFTVCWPADHKGQGTVLVGVIDMTQQKRAFAELEASERRYRDLFQHIPVALVHLDLSPLFERLEVLRQEGIPDLATYVEQTPDFLDEVLRLPLIEDANAEALRLFGAGDPAELRGPIGWGWREGPETIRRSLTARLRGAGRYSEETRVMRRDGTAVDVLYTISFSQSPTERGINVAGFVDISEQRRAETRLQQMQAEFAHAARVSTMGELTASIAHEVNQPLAAIRAYGEASLRWMQRLSPDLAEVAMLTRNIVADAQRASEIIARIRGMALKRDPDPCPVSLNDVVEEALLIVRHESLDKRVTVRTRLALALPPVLADRVQVQQVVVNLAVNAIQATAGINGERVLTVTTQRSTDGIELVIEDSGGGIAPGHIDQLFSGFFTTKEDGMGMGLPICRSIVQAHGGRISAANGVAGARFVVTLPAA